MTKFAKLIAVAGCCAGMTLVGCQSTRSVDASGGAACADKAGCCGTCESSSVDVQAGECSGKTECTSKTWVDVQASECSTAKTCPMTGKAIDVQASECSGKTSCSK